jgi:hypothetical protein
MRGRVTSTSAESWRLALRTPSGYPPAARRFLATLCCELSRLSPGWIGPPRRRPTAKRSIPDHPVLRLRGTSRQSTVAGGMTTARPETSSSSSTRRSASWRGEILGNASVFHVPRLAALLLGRPIIDPLGSIGANPSGVRDRCVFGAAGTTHADEGPLARFPVPRAVVVLTGDGLAVPGPTCHPVIVVAAILPGLVASTFVVDRRARGSRSRGGGLP